MLPQDMLFIGDNDPVPVTPKGYSTGHIPRDYSAVPYGAQPFASKFDLPVIPRSEWGDRVKAMEGSSIKDLYLAAVADPAVQMKCKDQNGTNYCWVNAPTMAVELLRLVQNQPYVDLSPASAGGPIKNYRNVGGWGGEALERIVSHGVCASSIWPANGISSKYNTQEATTNAALHKVTEWWELEPRNLDQLATCLFYRIPVPIGLNWWGHEVTAVSMDVDGVWILNSWGMGYGSNGLAKLSFSKATPDDAVAPRVTVPSVS